MSMMNKALGLSPEILTLRARRTELIAKNLANSDTPHYKAVDIDFGEALAMARNDASPGRLTRTDSLHLDARGGAGLSADMRYRIPSQPSLDGNTVETDREHMAFMDNAIRYQASLNFLDGRFKNLVLALRGE